MIGEEDRPKDEHFALGKSQMHFVETNIPVHDVDARRPLSQAAGLFHTSSEKRLLAWHWPGNVRELRNMLEQIVLMATNDAITPDELLLPSALEVNETVPAESEPIFDNTGKTVNLEGMDRHFLATALKKST